MFWLLLLSSFLLLGESKQMTKGYQNNLFFTSHILFSISSKFQTMQSFASLQHCLLSVAFQSTHQILLLHFQGLLSVQERLLSFLVSLTFQSLSLFKSWYFATFSLSFSPTITSAGTAKSMIFFFHSFLSIKIMSGLLASFTLSL